MYAILYSGGKDSTLAYHIAKKYGMEITHAVIIKAEENSYMYHTPTIDIARDIAEQCVGLNVKVFRTSKGKEKELDALDKAFKYLHEANIEGIITGAVRSTYQAERIQKYARKHNLEVFNPLWLKKDEDIVRLLKKYGIKAIITKIAAYGLSKELLGKNILDVIPNLMSLREEYGFSIIGEGGEIETLALDGTYFFKKVVVNKYEIKETSLWSAELIVKDYDIKS